jgi:hypothetical protein
MSTVLKPENDINRFGDADQSDPTDDMPDDPAYSEDGNYGFIWSVEGNRWIKKN